MFNEFAERTAADCQQLRELAQYAGLPARDLGQAEWQRNLRKRRYRSTRLYLLGREMP